MHDKVLCKLEEAAEGKASSEVPMSIALDWTSAANLFAVLFDDRFKIARG
ncbi:hypothetical protein [Ralstonia soli]|uniref:Uncharacterized protein n=1 Tax=Ralstonia soli TaxID=2953896 RepID=A0ABT1AEE1_9RALS|nr:hypothetical protein [Ralstonia soli]MCO5396743.1 hypothetical protein [Ralstonia soli]